MTGFMLRSKMNDREQAWYDSLSESDHEELRNQYIDKIVSRNLNVSYESFVLLVAKIGAMDKKKQDRVAFALERKLKKEGLK